MDISDHVQETFEDLRQLNLPLENVKTCTKGGKKSERLSICSSCGESAYCGSACQKHDWPIHKSKCGKAKTDRIALSAFYPLIAVLMEAQRVHPERPTHPALTRKIINSPNPNTVEGICRFPDNTSAQLVLLGEEISQAQAIMHPHEWWPTAITDQVRNKLFRRFYSENFLLPSIVATLVALMAEMYTTTYIASTESPDGTPKRRVRLTYRNSPISDFGIAKGWADVKNQDKLAYYSVPDRTFAKGQDPDDHYWIYFTTAAGSEIILDCGMFTFNFCMMVNTHAYIKHALPPQLIAAPAFFRDRPFRQVTPDIQHERARFSVLRNTKLRDAIQHSASEFRIQDSRAIGEFMEEVAGRKCTSIERRLVMTWCVDACEVMGKNIAAREYLNFPEDPPLGFQSDPGEVDDAPREDNEAWLKYMKKWTRKQRRGEITNEQLGEAFRAWKDKASRKGSN